MAAEVHAPVDDFSFEQGPGRIRVAVGQTSLAVIQ
jgi:hypothetical protein